MEVDQLDMPRGLVSIVLRFMPPKVLNGHCAERAKKLITICTNSRTHSVESDFAVTLKVVEGELE